MEKLYKGLHSFKKNFFSKQEELFRRLSHRQSPEILFITCADSRIDPNLVTQSSPGELFIIRYIGNIVPPFDAVPVNNGAAAALEYAVNVLKVPDIIVCGHSNCGAMNALMSPGSLADLPNMRSWLQLASSLRSMVDQLFPNMPDDERYSVIARENVLLQLKNMQTYPFIADALTEETLHIHGWYYDIGTGTISAYNPEADRFDKVA
jgi:carbonic anhydrase